MILYSNLRSYFLFFNIMLREKYAYKSKHFFPDKTIYRSFLVYVL